MTYRDRQLLFRREPLQLSLPQVAAIAVAATAVGADQKTARFRVAGLAHVPPPLSDALHGELGGVAAHSEVDPAFVLADIVNPIGHRLGNFRVREIVRQYFDRIALWTPLPARIFIVPDQLLLLCVHRDHWPAATQRRDRLIVDIAKLGIPVWMIHLAFRTLEMTLKRIVQLLQEIRNRAEADGHPVLLQRPLELAHAQGRPAQRRLRIPPHRWLNQRLKLGEQLGLMIGQPFATTSGPTHALSLPLKRPSTPLQLPQPTRDGVARKSRRARHPRHSAPTYLTRFGCCPHAARALAHDARQSLVFQPDVRDTCHGCALCDLPVTCESYSCTRP